MPRPLPTEYAPFYQTYVDRVEGDELHMLLSSYSQASLDFWQSIPEELGSFAYAPGKWTVMQVLNHLKYSNVAIKTSYWCFQRYDLYQ